MLRQDEAWVVRESTCARTNRMSMGGGDRKNMIGRPKRSIQ